MRSRHPLALVLTVVLAVGPIQLGVPATTATAQSAAGRPGAAVAGHTAAPATTPLDPLIPTAVSLATLAAGLPDDPTEAAESLVGTVVGDDDAAAVAATGELLRRAGLPLVSAAGPVVALPDGPTIISDPIDVELLPTLTRSIREGTEFTPEQLAGTLTYLGVTSTTLPAAAVVGTLAAWGKGPGEPTESVIAGAAVRALAHVRGQLLVPAAMPDAKTLATLRNDPGSLTAQQLSVLSAPGRLSGLDPLTFILFVAHAAGQVVSGATVGPGQPSAPGLRRPASSDCGTIQSAPENTKGLVKKQLRTAIKTAVDLSTTTDKHQGYGHYVDAGFSAYDKGTDIVTTTLLLLGATIDLVASPTSTHFRHESGDRSRDVLFVANAAFSGPLAAQHLSCWSLAGIDLPPNGPLNGFRVRWEVFGSLPVLQTKTEDSDKLLHGEPTHEGVSTLWMYPRTETHPPEPGESVPEQNVSEIVVASLDKDDFPFKLTDLLGIADPKGMALDKAWDIAVAWMQKVGLPSKRMRYPVSFHANSPYVIAARTTMQIPGYASVQLDADLYSCQGPSGPWKGTVTLSGEAGAILAMAGKLAGADTSHTAGSVTFPMNFTLDDTSASAQRIPFGDKLGLVVDLDPDAIATQEHPQSLNDTWDRLGNRAIVGDGSYIFGGTDLRAVVATTAGGLFQGAEYQVVGVMRDDRCPGASYWDDRFDSE